MKIYTKTGDNGTTSLYGGERVSKHDIRVEAYGTVDELNSNIGMLRDIINDKEIESSIIEIQKVLFKIGGLLATDPTKKLNSAKIKKLEIIDSDIKFLESQIDLMNLSLSKMTHFIIPGGNEIVSYCHICRSISRRAERRVTQLIDFYMVNKNIIPYMNRLSDYLFTVSRKVSDDMKSEEIKWIP